MEVNIIRNSIKGAAVLLGTALVMAGCQRESLAPESGAQYDGKISYAPCVAGIGSGSVVKSGLSDGSAVIGSESLTLRSADGRFTIPMTLTVTGAQAADVTSGAPTKSTLINEKGGITASDFATAISNTFWVAAWSDDATPEQIIPDAYALDKDEEGKKKSHGFADGGYVSGNDDDGYYQKVLYRESHGASGGHYWMTVQPQTVTVAGAPTDADDEYIWQEDPEDRGKNKGVIKTFYAYANILSSSMKLLPDGAGQTMTCTGVPSQDILMGYYNGNGGGNGTASIRFYHPLTAVKFLAGDLADGAEITGISIENVYGGSTVFKVTQNAGSFTWTKSDDTPLEASDATADVSVSLSDDETDNPVLLIPQTFTAASKSRICVTIEQDEETFSVYYPLDGTTWSAGVINTYTIGYNPTSEDPDLLPGKFSISATDYVQFSKGNLFCTRSGSEGSYTYKFGFESHQYDCRSRYGYDGDKAMIDGSEKETPVNTSGLFQWNCVNGVIPPDYGAFTKNTSAALTGDATDLLEFGNSIDGPFDWITLSLSDWEYIFKKRQNSANLYKLKVEVCGMNGLILAPDDYSGTIFDKYSSETTPTWAEAEADGLVFLPYAGMWLKDDASTPISYWGTGLRYWAVDGASSTNANRLRFESYNGTDSDINLRGAGRQNAMSVRLVQRFPKDEIEPTFVDLDLPSGLMWANVNLGAVAETGPGSIGNYYFWGETEPWFKTQYVSSTSMLITDWLAGHRPTTSDNVTTNVYQQYANMYDRSKTGTEGYIASDLTGDYAEYDAVIAKGWKGRMPTSAEWEELWNNTAMTRSTTVDGIVCYKFASKKNSAKYILLPTAGRFDKSYGFDIDNMGKYCQYWSSTSVSTDKTESYCFSGRSGAETNYAYERFLVALPIRAVKAKATYPGWVDLGIKSDNGKQLLWCEYDVIGIDANGIATLASDNEAYHSTMFTWTQAASIKGIASMPDGVSGTVRLPSYTEIGELKDASTGSTFKWINSGVKGGKITLNGQTIFYPANGYYSGSLQQQGTSARYWCGTEDKRGKLIINYSSVGHNVDVNDVDGLSVRLVIEVSPAD